LVSVVQEDSLAADSPWLLAQWMFLKILKLLSHSYVDECLSSRASCSGDGGGDFFRLYWGFGETFKLSPQSLALLCPKRNCVMYDQ